MADLDVGRIQQLSGTFVNPVAHGLLDGGTTSQPFTATRQRDLVQGTPFPALARAEQDVRQDARADSARLQEQPLFDQRYLPQADTGFR